VCAESSDGFPTYPYRNIAYKLIGRIESDDLRPAARVPSERKLAAEYGISRITARTTLNLLGQRGATARDEVTLSLFGVATKLAVLVASDTTF
jgi:DNA-binding transcriptional regulator YhcF (GntR family)